MEVKILVASLCADALLVGPAATPAPAADTQAGPAGERRGPSVMLEKPYDGARRVKVGTVVKATFSEPVMAATITPRSVRLVKVRPREPVPARLTYRARHHQVVLDPRRPLARRSWYRVKVTSAVRDSAGNRLDQSRELPGLQGATWSFRTR